MYLSRSCWFSCRFDSSFRWQLRFAAFVFSCLSLFGVPANGQQTDRKTLSKFSPDLVLNGIDVLIQENFRSLRGRNVGLISNHTGISLDRKPTAVLIAQHPDVQLRTIFSPEHGYSGKLDQSLIKDNVDLKTGIKVASLYGKNRSPQDKDLKGIDTVVFDIQDIGTRYYTYISTMGSAMKKCAKNGIRFVVLDRPNPINGLCVQGPVLETGQESFVGCHTFPNRHGMTVGEIAAMLKVEWNLKLDLQIIKLQGWRRSDFFDRTGQCWVNPSPNIRNLNQALLYPGIGMLETTNLSVGRGTDSPFEIIGAPWINGQNLAAKLNQCQLSGVRFIPFVFVPNSSKFKGEECQGVQILITNRQKLHPVKTGYEIGRVLSNDYSKQWKTGSLNRLIGNKKFTDGMKAGKSWNEVRTEFEPSLKEFQNRRMRFLLY